MKYLFIILVGALLLGGCCRLEKKLCKKYPKWCCGYKCVEGKLGNSRYVDMIISKSGWRQRKWVDEPPCVWRIDCPNIIELGEFIPKEVK